MKKNNLKLLCTLVITLFGEPVFAQNHLYGRIEIGTENGWSWIGATVISAFVNTSIHYPLIESNMTFSAIDSDIHLKNFTDDPEYDENGKEKEMSAGYFKYDGRHLFNHLALGGKIGYLSDRLGWLNYCAYGSAYYNFRQLRSEDYLDVHEIQRLQLGGGAMLIFGSVESNSRFILDGGLRYNIPMGYKTKKGLGELDMLNSGLTSHYSLKYSYKQYISVGLFCNFMHYNLFKEKYSGQFGKTNKIYEFGLTIQVLQLFDD